MHPWFRWTETTIKWDGVGTWILLIETSTKVLHGDGGESAARLLDADTVELVASTAADGCAVGDTGTYDWSLSSSRRILDLVPEADQCAPRMVDLEGEWILSDCPAFPEDFCLGPLDRGPHVANFFDPMWMPASEWHLDPGAMSYRVPGGWSNTYDAVNEYLLEPVVKTGDTGVYMWTDVTIVSDEGPCNPSPRAEGRASPEEFVAWLAEQETLETAEPVDVTIGGLEGLSVDLAVRPEATLPCRGAGPYAPFLVHVEGSGLQWGFKKDTRNRLYFLDAIAGRTLVIHVAADDQDPEQLLADGIGIVESIELR